VANKITITRFDINCRIEQVLTILAKSCNIDFWKRK